MCAAKLTLVIVAGGLIRIGAAVVTATQAHNIDLTPPTTVCAHNDLPQYGCSGPGQ
jgi:hypothetical protein